MCLRLKRRTHHVHDLDVSVGEHEGVGRVGHWKQEGEGCAEGGGDEDVQRVDMDGLRLQTNITHKHTNIRHGNEIFISLIRHLTLSNFESSSVLLGDVFLIFCAQNFKKESPYGARYEANVAS